MLDGVAVFDYERRIPQHFFINCASFPVLEKSDPSCPTVFLDHNNRNDTQSACAKQA